MQSCVRSQSIKGIVVAVLVSAVSCGFIETDEQRRAETIETIRDIGTAIEAYTVVNNGEYPVNETGDLLQLESKLAPKFIQHINTGDGWNNPIRYYCFHSKGPYYIISYGEDGKEDLGIYHSPGRPTDTSFVTIDNPFEDIIFSQGEFVRYPKGVK